MGKLKKIAYPAENNQFIYFPKRILDQINKKAVITSMQAVGGSGGKVVIEYRSKKHNISGKMELNDLGPDKNNI